MNASSHTATAEPSPQHWTVSRGETTVASSDRVLMVIESFGGRTLDPVPYFPLADVDQNLLTATSHQTACPVKGAARYYSVTAAGETLENAVWQYPNPNENLAEIGEYVSFYGDRFEIVPTPAA